MSENQIFLYLSSASEIDGIKKTVEQHYLHRSGIFCLRTKLI